MHYDMVGYAYLIDQIAKGNIMRIKFKALTADVYRVRKDKSVWNIYRTYNGIVLNTGKTYRYFNTKQPFHNKAKAVVDIRGVERVEQYYNRG